MEEYLIAYSYFDETDKVCHATAYVDSPTDDLADFIADMEEQGYFDIIVL